MSTDQRERNTRVWGATLEAVQLGWIIDGFEYPVDGDDRP